MCRLFGLHGGQRRIAATFWLLESPASLAVQSRTQPDGFGIGTFEEDDSPEVDKGPIRAIDDELFAREARLERSRTFVAHLRFASTGPAADANTHPFEQHGRLFAHNGVLWGLEELERRLGEHRSLVHGDTDSERLFALITRETQLRGGDLGEGDQGGDRLGGGCAAGLLAELRAGHADRPVGAALSGDQQACSSSSARSAARTAAGGWTSRARPARCA